MGTEPGAGGPSLQRTLAAVLPAAVVPFLGSLVYFVAYSGETWARWAYVGVKAFTLVWPLVATVWILRRRFPGVDWRSPRHRRALPLGAAIGVAVVAGVLLLMETPVGAVVISFAPQIRHKVAQLGVLDQFVAFGLFLSIAHSGLEEYYWRWFLYGRLRSLLGLPAAVSTASLAFAAHHVVILSQYVTLPWMIVGTLAVVLAGGVWCLMYERQGTLTGAWLSHILADVAVLWVGYRILF